MTVTIEQTELENNRAQLESQMQSFAILGNALKAGKPTRALIASLQEDYGYTRDTVSMGDELDTYARAVSDDVLDVEWTYRKYALLCTGGPHCEIRAGRAFCYGWFGSDEVNRPLKKSERIALDYLFG